MPIFEFFIALGVVCSGVMATILFAYLMDWLRTDDPYSPRYDIDRSLILKGVEPTVIQTTMFDPGRIYHEETVKAWEWQAAMNNPGPRMAKLRRFKRKVSRKG